METASDMASAATRFALSCVDVLQQRARALDPFTLLLCVVGAFVLGRFFYRAMAFIWLYLLRPRTSMNVYGARKGTWAVVTGASDGIGRAFARRLAKDGFNVALVSRSKDKLESVAKIITESCPKSETLLVACDASNPSSPGAIAKALEGRDVRVLVNNVGVSNAIPIELSQMSESEIAHIINVNALFNAQLTRTLIPLLKNNGNHGRNARSAILNVSSVAAVVAVPLQSIYAGTKAFNDTFSRALSAELQPYGIDVLSCSPAYVKSNMSGFRRTNAMVLSPDAFVRAALGKIGYSYSLVPNVAHAIYLNAIMCIPESFRGPFIRGKMLLARKKLLRRQERINKAA